MEQKLENLFWAIGAYAIRRTTYKEKTTNPTSTATTENVKLTDVAWLKALGIRRQFSKI